MAKKPAKVKTNGKHKNGNGTTKEPKTKKAKGGRRPEGGLGLRDDERQALHFRHVKEFERAQATKKEADTQFKETKDRIKEEGGTISAIELTLKLRTEEGQAAFQAALAEQAEIAKWNGVGVQLNMFTPASADAIYEDGKRSAMNDEPAKPPAHLAQKAAQRWLSGHSDGRTALNVTRAGNFKPLGDVAASVANGLKVPPETDAYPGGEAVDAAHALAS